MFGSEFLLRRRTCRCPGKAPLILHLPHRKSSRCPVPTLRFIQSSLQQSCRSKRSNAGCSWPFACCAVAGRYRIWAIAACEDQIEPGHKIVLRYYGKHGLVEMTFERRVAELGKRHCFPDRPEFG